MGVSRARRQPTLTPSSMHPIERRDAETDRVSQNNSKACEPLSAPLEGPQPARVLKGAHEGVSHCEAKMGSMEATTPATCIRRHLGGITHSGASGAVARTVVQASSRLGGGSDVG